MSDTKIELTKNFFKSVLADFKNSNSDSHHMEITGCLQITYTAFTGEETVCMDGDQGYKYCILDEIPTNLIDALLGKKKPVINVRGVSAYPKYINGHVQIIIRLLNISVVSEETDLLNVVNTFYPSEIEYSEDGYDESVHEEISDKDDRIEMSEIESNKNYTFVIQVIDKSGFNESQKSKAKRQSNEGGQLHTPSYNYSISVMDEFGNELKFRAFERHHRNVYDNLLLEHFYLVNVNVAELSSKNKEFGYKTNLDIEIVLNSNEVKFKLINKVNGFLYVNPKFQYSKFSEVKNGGERDVNIIGTIIAIDKPSPFVLNDTSKSSVMRHIFFVDDKKDVVAVSLFGYKCFKFDDKDIGKSIAIRNVNVIYINKKFHSLSSSVSTCFYNFPEFVLKKLNEKTDKFNIEDLVLPVLKKIDTEEEIFNKLYTIHGLVTKKLEYRIEPQVINGFYRICRWGKKFYHVPKDKPEALTNVYAKIVLLDDTGRLDNATLFFNKISKFLNISETKLSKLYDNGQTNAIHDIIDPLKEMLLFIKIRLSDNDTPEKIYLNRTIEDIKLPNLKLYTKFLAETNKYIEDKKMIGNYEDA
uniref:AAA_12 domain-containing protein n=1 Tax=Strongyloides papillosus TaxID=174720 RepID=A0A0N5B2L9_STREA